MKLNQSWGNNMEEIQVTAYKANDGSLWFNQSECSERNERMLLERVKKCIYTGKKEYNDYLSEYELIKSVISNFDAIKTILGK